MSSPLWEGVREGCGTCEFWLRQGSGEFGTCKRYPPTLLAQHITAGDRSWLDVEQHLPTMAEPDWCGEYKRRGT